MAKITVNSFACFICVVYLGYNEIEKYSNPDKRFSVYSVRKIKRLYAYENRYTGHQGD